MSVHSEISPEAQELALTVINDGAGYLGRCGIARNPSPHYRAGEWAAIATHAAMAFDREFSPAGGSHFTASDILQAAVELEAYYDAHVTENDAAQKAAS
jgi:hypothetical protein